MTTVEDEPQQLETFYKSNLITKLSTEKMGGIKFTIKNIDSLGNYLSPVFSKDFFQFKYKQDTLTIIDGNGNPFKEDNWSCCHSYIEITSDKRIKNIHTENSFIKKRGDKITIHKTRKSFYKKGKNTKLVIVFDK